MHTHSLLALDRSGFRKLVYQEWGSPKCRRIVICVHGLTRNGRDFDYLANALSSRYRVICPDMAGRGESDWLEHKEDYGFSLYQADATLLLARVTAPPRAMALPWGRIRDNENVEIDWVGTSMGGLIGMMIAAQPASPIRKLVLNDVGPLVPWQALLRLKGYVGRPMRFATLDEAEKHVRDVCATFGNLTDAQWRHLATHSVRRDGDGFCLAYDPAISSPTAGVNEFANLLGAEAVRGIDLWGVWDKIKCPTLVLRGAESDLLLADTTREMTQRGPKATAMEFPGVGHAPALMDERQIRVIRDFLDGGSI
jgi:pimeloyl-ACP methyl ester carboxylesterase